MKQVIHIRSSGISGKRHDQVSGEVPDQSRASLCGKREIVASEGFTSKKTAGVETESVLMKGFTSKKCR